MEPAVSDAPCGAAVVARRSALPRRCGGSPDEVGERDVEGVGEDEKVVEVGRPMRVLPSTDALGITAGAFTKLFLRKAGCLPGGAELSPDGPSAGEDPGGRGVAMHPTRFG
jgi:hypothetical protein